MIRSKTRRKAATFGAALIAAGGLLATTATPAGATSSDSSTLIFVPYNGQTYTIWRNGNTATPAYFTASKTIEGDFGGPNGTDVFLYNPGSGADGILSVSPNMASFTYSLRNETINGTYTPVVGDFDGNAIDDILWYAPGAGADSIWLFKPDGSHTTTSVTINGTYKPTAINTDGDGYTDIIWYAPGTAADSIWRFSAGANHSTKSVAINGSYQLIPGHFSDVAEGSPQRRLIFFNKNGADSIWTFDTNANHTSAPLPNVDGNFRPIVGEFTNPNRDAVIFYRAGTGSERFFSFAANGTVNDLEPPNVNGTYDPEVGDYDGNGYQDIAWASGGKATLWKFTSGGYTQQNIVTSTVNTMPATIDNFRFPA
ncbi:MAG: FG-GAP repeat domain-containing protein [Aquihabitans sp.]